VAVILFLPGVVLLILIAAWLGRGKPNDQNRTNGLAAPAVALGFRRRQLLSESLGVKALDPRPGPGEFDLLPSLSVSAPGARSWSNLSRGPARLDLHFGLTGFGKLLI
jgi:hypothetical protein